MKTITTDDGVFLDGIKGFSAADFAASPHGATARIFEALGEPISYEDLTGFSGFTYRVQVHKGFCPSAGHPACGGGCMDGYGKANPFQTQRIERAPWSSKDIDEAQQETEAAAMIKASIDRGAPLQYGGEEEGFIFGYADQGKRWRCFHPYHKKGAEPFWFDEAKGFAGGKWPWFIVAFGDRKPDSQIRSRTELLKFGMDAGIELWDQGAAGDYLLGDAAYAHWIEWLNGIESGAIERDEYKKSMLGNAWCFDVLVHCRRIGSAWLKTQAEQLNEEAAAALNEVAELYAQIHSACMKDLDCPWNLTLAPERVDEWTSEMRQRLIERLEASRELDAKAITALRNASVAMSEAVAS